MSEEISLGFGPRVGESIARFFQRQRACISLVEASRIDWGPPVPVSFTQEFPSDLRECFAETMAESTGPTRGTLQAHRKNYHPSRKKCLNGSCLNIGGWLFGGYCFEHRDQACAECVRYIGLFGAGEKCMDCRPCPTHWGDEGVSKAAIMEAMRCGPCLSSLELPDPSDSIEARHRTAARRYDAVRYSYRRR